VTSLSDLPVRDDLRGRRPYGAPQESVPVALNVNENTHPVPAEVAEDITRSVAEALRSVNRYPDREFTQLREGFAAYLGHGLSAEQIWAANGSNEVLQHILQAFGGPGRSLMSFTPSYSMYPLLASGTGTRWIGVPRESDYTIDPVLAADAVRAEDPTLIFLCSPNNPTGTPLPLETIEAVYAASRGIVVVDEAYAEFAAAGTASALALLPGRERLIVSRTMSKAFSFAGARVGYLAADPAVIDALRLVRLPYHLSALTQAAALAALRHAPLMLAAVADIVVQRDRIERRLAELGYRVHPSASNFVLFGAVPEPRALFEALLERGILIRDVGIPEHLRVTAGTQEETTAFLEAMTELSARPEFGPLARLEA